MVQPILARHLDEWMLLPRPERVTELFFTEHYQIPDSISPGAPQTIAFTVRNFEHRTTEYHYILIAMPETGTKEHILGRGSFTLSDNRSLVTRKTVKLPILNERISVKVSLEYKGIAYGDKAPSTQKQSVQYWLAPNIPDKNEENHEDA
jgi:hypothetical protein